MNNQKGISRMRLTVKFNLIARQEDAPGSPRRAFHLDNPIFTVPPGPKVTALRGRNVLVREPFALHPPAGYAHRVHLDELA